MALVTTIRWRPYPEQKPPKGGWYAVMAKAGKFFGIIQKHGVIGRECYRVEGDSVYGEGWAQDHNLNSTRGIEVTHFALPEDIHTEDLP